MTTQGLIDYYVKLLISQYVNLTNAPATISAYVKQAIADQIIDQVNNGFNFGTIPGIAVGSAIGAQLDAVASYRGAMRKVFGLDLTRTYFLMPVYGDAAADTDPGFALYGETPIGWYFKTYEDEHILIYQLNDDELYRLTQLRAQVQSQLLSVENVDDILFSFFSTNVSVFENPPMKIVYFVLISYADSLFGIAAATNSLPRPAGVEMTVVRSETINEFFGFQIYGEVIDPDFVGFGLYGTPQTGSFVRYS